MKKLKIILINILLGTIPILLIAALIYSYTRNDIIEVTNQTHIIEPLTVIKTDIKASNLKSNHRTFTESDIYGELIMRYQLSNGETYQDKFNLRQIHNHQLPDNESVLTKTNHRHLTKRIDRAYRKNKNQSPARPQHQPCAASRSSTQRRRSRKIQVHAS